MTLRLSILVLVAVLAAGAATAQERSLGDTRERLSDVRERMKSLEQSLLERHQRVDGLDAELQRLDKSLAEADRALRETRQKLDAHRKRLAELKAEHQRRSEALAGERGRLADQIRAAWASGGHSFLRVMLSQERPDRLDRLAVYYRYFANARAERIDETIAALERLESLQQSIDGELARLRELEDRRAGQRQALAEKRESRKAVLEKLRAGIDSDDQRLDRLRDDEQRLTGLVKDLRERLEQQRRREAAEDRREEVPAPEPPESGGDRNGWPVAGKLLASYGSSRSGDLRWSGVLIGAPAGTAVHAVAGGRVVFSDWLRGVGLLIIIDHGDGRMSLYGHNRALYREAGDRVSAGEVIAAVGASGGQRREALYFEVRVDGDPVDPLAWLKRRGNRG
ncbi:peptidoglycan DD-metalloendopeptidase family protein [Arhodomonas aquaeolei]|uniref:murein hydrolase activator EnvC family protein n=1 Tax=Arhodomonas aquaeolei TaxID=2369 RepID=UPI000377DCF2|nr:peptidoglycan DD-metalloendopeptidase family protein [Arhodomonas aquaeolei]MCS4505395.1 peptidoglycan DD-metalloendopeptidase family protein [Arhodomonas aquaeolei]